MADDVVVDLPLAEHEPLDALSVSPDKARVVECGPELAARQILERRARLLQPQKPLRGHDHEGPRGCVERLPPQQVEVLAGRGAVGDP